MSGATYFVQECPVCGRYLQVRVELLGKRVGCRHCQGTFVACDALTTPRDTVRPPKTFLLDRANELLASVELPKSRPH